MSFNIAFFMCLLVIEVIQGNWIFPDQVDLSGSEVLNKRCGNSPYTERFKPEDGRLFENPWLILLRHPEDTDSFCQGTLLTDRHVLTTAICSEAIVENETVVVLGEYDRSTELDCDSNRKCAPPITELIVLRIITHPEFKNDSYENDIALLTLNDYAKLGNTITPICLPLISILLSRIHEPIMYNTLWPSEGFRPKQIPMKYVPHETCEMFTQNQLILHDGQICAKYRTPIATRLHAGAGSPLLVEHHDLTFQLGILSVGLPNASFVEPYVYVNVSTHVTWIHYTILSDMQ